MASLVRAVVGRLFYGLPVTVEPEKDLSAKKQLLDCLVVHKEAATLDCVMPDGFDDFGTYNVITFRSYRDALTLRALRELLGHFVNVHKQVSPSLDEKDLLAEEQFRLYAVCVHYPKNVEAAGESLEEVRPGVYEVKALGLRIRVVVINQLPLEPHNAVLHLFTNQAKRLGYGAKHYRVRSTERSSFLYQLFQRLEQEVPEMRDQLEQLHRETVAQILKETPVEKRLEGVPLEKLLAALSPEQRAELARLLKANGSSPQTE